MTVNWRTSASLPSPAMNATLSATLSTGIMGSTLVLPSAWAVPTALFAERLVRALPMSNWVAMMPCFLPSREVHFVSPRIACFETVYAAESGRGDHAEMDPLLMIRPPCGVWSFMILIASRVHW